MFSILDEMIVESISGVLSVARAQAYSERKAGQSLKISIKLSEFIVLVNSRIEGLKDDTPNINLNDLKERLISYGIFFPNEDEFELNVIVPEPRKI